MNFRLRIPPIYAITDRAVCGTADLSQIARRLYGVGVRWIQVREKTLPDGELLSSVEEIDRELGSRGATVIVNDRVDIARMAAVGVHLGEQDMPARDARPLLAPGRVLGVSTRDLEAARKAFGQAEPDYLSFGPVFASDTKMVSAPRGLQELARVASIKTKPLVAIGGITAERLDSVWDAGADSAAMVSGLLAAGKIEENARRALDRARRRSPAGRVYLVGFMGSGKTLIGRRAAERLGVPFVDLDAEIERRSGLTVRALFEASGERAFRERETSYLEGTETLPQAVVATGGGCFAQEQNRRLISRLGTSVFLDVPFERVGERLAGKTDRPLFQTPEQALQLYTERNPLYRMAAVRVGLTGWEDLEGAVDLVLNAVFDRRLAESGPVGL